MSSSTNTSLSCKRNEPEEYFDSTKVVIHPISKPVAKEIIEANHYSHSWTKCHIAFGVYYKESASVFFEGEGSEKLIGAVVYGDPVGRLTVQSISPLITQGEVLELTRLWIADGYGRNIESYSVGQTFKYIRKNIPRVKAIISYSDPEAGHIGTIYQALNFLYQGAETRKVDSFWFMFNEYGGWLHPRTVSARYGTTNDKELLRFAPDGFKKKEMHRKHRYLLFLAKDKQKYLDSLTHKVMPYPKSSKELNEEVITVTKETVA